MSNISTSVPYAMPADIREAHDFRQCGDFTNDDGTRETTAAAFDASAKVNTALMKASGMIESACLKGERYTVADLQGLSGAGRYFLVDVCVELAWWKINERRFAGKPLPPETLWAFSVLEELGSGAKILSVQEAATAGRQDSDFMTAADYANLGLASYQARRMFGRRANMTRSGCGGDFTNDDGC